MTDVLITEAEIKALRDGATTITIDDVLGWERKPVLPILLASGFKVSMSVSGLEAGKLAEHVSVYNPAGKTDPADAERIAAAVLGKGYMVWGGGLRLPENIHFIKLIQNKKQEE